MPIDEGRRPNVSRGRTSLGARRRTAGMPETPPSAAVPFATAPDERLRRIERSFSRRLVRHRKEAGTGRTAWRPEAAGSVPAFFRLPEYRHTAI
ncbi:hypothetical protein AvCA_26330 [Azotobacter vinelandii CA]|uniref:Uncharacterized protein n=2 Tax=Azotobacter vinelandii TaxID=354 RepID=C1DJP0_AZOVD|nr:hypothetical protein Avin_26330 [Azotobacter vinelandii DJ]AGK14901.1 hypothetical protein AvCA_26330 [Azotobacter vinelandii CA]AGK20763.1 hypothetical protein AvCA6_26330 [Azotobacter vinelandii CA6]